VQEMLTRYLEQSVGTVLRQQQTLQAQMAKALEAPLAPLAPIADLARQNMALLSTMQSSVLSAFGVPKPDEAATGGSDSSDEKNKP